MVLPQPVTRLAGPVATAHLGARTKQTARFWRGGGVCGDCCTPTAGGGCDCGGCYTLRGPISLLGNSEGTQRAVALIAGMAVVALGLTAYNKIAGRRGR